MSYKIKDKAKLVGFIEFIVFTGLIVFQMIKGNLGMAMLVAEIAVITFIFTGYFTDKERKTDFIGGVRE